MEIVNVKGSSHNWSLFIDEILRREKVNLKILPSITSPLKPIMFAKSFIRYFRFIPARRIVLDLKILPASGHLSAFFTSISVYGTGGDEYPDDNCYEGSEINGPS
jgi:hypothetical protein